MVTTIPEKEAEVMRGESVSSKFTPPSHIDVVQGPALRSGTPIVTGFMPAGLVIPDRYEIPYYDPRTKRGYQRQPQESRVNELANDLRKGRTDLPTAVLLNIRDLESQDAVKNKRLGLELSRRSESTHMPTKFYVVDGQHRVLALKKLIDEESDRWSSLMIPFVCMLGATEEEEMTQFYIVNSTAKSVRTDLALALLRRRADDDAEVYEALRERGREWQVDGQALVERLAVQSPIWKHRIRLAGLEKGDTTITSASMVASLKPLLGSPFFGSLKPDHQMKILEAYWQGIRELLRPAFDEPTKYVVQKGVGVIVLHAVMPQTLELVRSKGWSVMEASSYSRVLRDALQKLEGDNANGEPVSGVDFWASAPNGGAAGSYSSSAGRRVLAAKIRQLLPEVEAE
jgi:DGQHR domain-containing protein